MMAAIDIRSESRVCISRLYQDSGDPQVKCSLSRSRAIDEHEKAQRRQSILDAARTLYQTQPDNLPSVMTIAQSAGLAKGTVYLYFKTKEEIFLSLLSSQYESLIDQLKGVARQAGEPDSQVIPAMVETVIEFTQTNPDFMPLATMASSVLEQNTEVHEVLVFKSMLITKLGDLAADLAERLSGLDATRCMELLILTNALILGLWQMQNHPPAVARIIREGHYSPLIPDFAPTLRDAMTLLWRGATVAAPAAEFANN